MLSRTVVGMKLALSWLVCLTLGVGCNSREKPAENEKVRVLAQALSSAPGTPAAGCGRFLVQLANGSVRYAITFSEPQAYVEVFVQRNGAQVIAQNIVANGVANGNGTYTYSYVAPASGYSNGNVLRARFYSYPTGQSGVFTPGPTATTWAPNFIYGQTACSLPPPSGCHAYIATQPNNDLKFSVTLPGVQQSVQVFVRQNGVQNVAQNIVGNRVANADGTSTYSLVKPAAGYQAGDVILTRFYSYRAGQPGVFTPGPVEQLWAPEFIVGSVCGGPVDDGNPCTIDGTGPSGPTHTPVPNGTACNDSNACTQSDTCQSGVCTGANPVVCSAQGVCRDAGVCNPASGACSSPPKADGTACDNSTVCDGRETCQAGGCANGTPATVDDGNPCTADSCDPVGGPAHQPVAAGIACDDGNACNGISRCNGAGTCLGGTPVVCAALDQCHAAGVCDIASGLCSNPAKPTGTLCNDGDACTQTDACQAGACVGSSPVVCSAIDTCHGAGTCDSVTGACSAPPRPDGSACADATVCNGAETCQAGSCSAGQAPTVDDGNPCTVDSCDPVLGVAHVAAADGTACDDVSLCNGREVCGGGACVPGTPVPTDDGVACTTDVCNPQTGLVTHTPAAPGTACDAIDACHDDGTCDSDGRCLPGEPLAFDDGDPCTVETCDPVSGLTRRQCAAPDLTVATTPADANAWIYSGTNPLQTGVAPGTIARNRGALVTGLVLSQSSEPLGGATISVLNHPEFGQTVSQTNGEFAMVVNGGGQLIVQVQKPGFLQVDRSLQVPWADAVRAADVILLQSDPVVTEIDLLDESEPYHVAIGSSSDDGDGFRQGTLLLPSNTEATMQLADGSLEPIDLLHVRITEFTVGETGERAMPAPLPPTSHYTYAFEVNADEAVAAGAKSVRFSEPLIYYVDNFLHFPSGTLVPVGSYDRDRGAWASEKDGLVITITSVAGGLANLSIDADAPAENPAELAAVGIQSAERARLASLYAPGTSLWRVLIPHFTQPWDLNWGVIPPQDAQPPPPQPPGRDPVPDPIRCENASSIECQNQVLQEELPIAGTGYSLAYSSRFAVGRSAVAQVRLSGTTVPASLLGIELFATTSTGEQSHRTFAPLPNQELELRSGKDLWGRNAQGTQYSKLELGYQYQGIYVRGLGGFASPSGGLAITGERARGTISLSRTFARSTGGWNQLASSAGLGGWSLNVHHNYDPSARAVILGDGTVQSATAVGLAAFTQPFNNTGSNEFIDVAADGTVFTTDMQSVVRIARDGTRTRIVGQRLTEGFAGDGGPAVNALLSRSSGTTGYGDVRVAPDGSVYIADPGNYRVRRISPDGIISTFAGTGSPPPGCCAPVGDGGPATSAQLNQPQGLTIGLDGSVYIADSIGGVVRRVTPNGIIYTVAGKGRTSNFERPADVTTARSSGDAINPNSVAVLPNGTLLVGDQRGWIRSYTTTGTVQTAAGIICVPNTCPTGPYIEGVPATQAGSGNPIAIVTAQDGTWYFTEYFRGYVHQVAPNGIATLLAGGGSSQNFRSNGAPARSISFANAGGLSLGPDGLYVRSTEFGREGITVLRPATPGIALTDFVVASRGGDEAYRFDVRGRHLDTRDTTTGAIKRTFAYDSHGLLSTVTDAFANTTRIERDGAGTATAIVSPDGQRTSLEMRSDGYLTRATDPLEQTSVFDYTPSGLLTSYQNTRGHVATMSYDAGGRLLRDQDAVGGAKVLSRTELPDGTRTTYGTEGAGTSTSEIRRLADGTERRTTQLADGTAVAQDRRPDGVSVTTQADGTAVTETQVGDSRFGLATPVVSRSVVLPSGLTRIESNVRTVALASAADPLSVTSITNQRSVNGRIWTDVYDAATKTWTFSTPQGRRTFRRLNSQGDLVEDRSETLLGTLFGYDSRGRLGTITQGSRETLFSYTPSGASSGYLESARNPLLQSTQFTRDSLGRVLTELDAAGNLTQFGWDPLSNLSSVTPPGRPAHEMSYTPVNLMQEYSPPLLASIPDGRTVYEYNTARQLERATRPDGVVTSYAYDTIGRLTDTTSPEGTSHRDYFGLIPCVGCAPGRLSRLTSPDGIGLAFTYDGPLLKSTTWSGTVNGAVSFTYNSDYRVRTETLTTASGSTAFQFGFDGDTLLTCASPTNCATPGADALLLTYDSNHGLRTGSTLGTTTEALTYNTTGELATQLGRAGSTTTFGESYDSASVPRDALGRIKRKAELVGGTTSTWDYSYDLAGRLEAVQLNGGAYESYTYDGNGNRLSVVKPSGTTSATYDAQDRLLTYGAWSYTYTANGELLTKTNSTTGEAWAYEYDVFGNLKRVDLPSGTVIEYLVDGQNRRVGKKRNGVLVKQWLYKDQLHPVAELDGAGNLVARFVFASGKNAPDVVVAGGVTYRVFTDQLGSPRALVNVATGVVTGVMRHDAWGVVLDDSVSSLMPFGFAGGLYDAETRLVRFGARDYDPVEGRWVSKDPIRFDGGQANVYVYVGNDPINRSDPFGLTDQEFGNLLKCSGNILACALVCDVATIGCYACLAKVFGDVDGSACYKPFGFPDPPSPPSPLPDCPPGTHRGLPGWANAICEPDDCSDGNCVCQ